jgi:hypothetical protein
MELGLAHCRTLKTISKKVNIKMLELNTWMLFLRLEQNIAQCHLKEPSLSKKSFFGLFQTQ